MLGLFFFLTIYPCAATKYQALVPGTLPGPIKPKMETQWAGSETAGPSSESTLSLHLQHIDAFIANTTADILFTRRLRRDSRRVRTLSAISNTSRKSFSSSVISGLAHGSGEYFTTIGIGTPPKYTYLVLDTGSDIIWIQCRPCNRCYHQNGPVFDPAGSNSFRPVACKSAYCHALDTPGCKRDKCSYQVAYGDGSVTFGELAYETLSFRETQVTGVVFGCGHYNEGLFVGAAGLLGLGRGKLSFPTLAGDRFDRKFSYCLVDRSASANPSSLLFGPGSVSRNAVFTPLVMNPKLDTFYYVTLNGISVGGSRVRGVTGSLFKLNPAEGSGGVILDSGTSVTRLTRPAYIALRDRFRSETSWLRSAPEFSLFDTCYDLSNRSSVRVPTVVLHFSGADVALPASNYLIPVDLKGTFCFAFAATSGGLSIIGNIQQQGFRVSFDLDESRVGFTPRGCA